MNYINRALVKQQAKDIIKGKVFYIFLVTFIVASLANMSVGFNIANNYNYYFDKNDFEFFNDNKGGYNEFYDYYSDFGEDFDGGYEYDNPIDDFEFDGTSSSPEITQLSINKAGGINAFLGGLMGRGIGGVTSLAGIAFMPLLVTLAGMYLSLVRKSPDEPFELGKELAGIFKNSFNDTYLKKLLVVILRQIFLVLWSILLIVPGIIFYYSSYFTSEIMSDNPNLKPTEAIRLSKKIVEGNRTELFVLELSFIPWYLLTIVTLGFASIYVLPYINTTKALYYENFRMRALQNGRITPDDFKSFDERIAGNNGSFAYGYTAPSPGASDYYYAPPQSGNQGNEGSYYYTDQSNDTPQSQQNNAAENAFEEQTFETPIDYVSKEENE
ncbi:MAG: DUF975 family protein [Eubacterium sp.]|nr:DUF975 family protein [Eubacterium sp.]